MMAIDIGTKGTDIIIKEFYFTFIKLRVLVSKACPIKSHWQMGLKSAKEQVRPGPGSQS